MGKAKTLAISVVTDSRRGVKGLKEVETAADRTARRVGRAGKIGGVALLALGAAAFKSAKAAAADEHGQILLASAMRKNANASDKSIASTEKWIDRTARQVGIADDELRPALATLVRANGSVAQSQKDLNLAMDISAATGKSVAQVSSALAKAYGGNTVALGRLVPGIDKAVLKSGSMAKITDTLTKKVGGDAAKAAQTNEGKTRRMTVAFGEMQEQLGAVLLPTINTVTDALSKSASFIQANSKTVTILVAVMGSLALIVVTINAAYRAYAATMLAVETIKKLSIITTSLQTAGQYALGTAWLAGRLAVLGYAAAMTILDAAMEANPLGVIVLALVAVGALFVLAYKKSATFRTIVQAVGHAGKAAIGWVVTAAQSLIDKLGGLPKILSIGKKIVVAYFKAYTFPIRTVISLVIKLVGWISKIKFPKIPGAIKKLGGIVGLGGAPKPPPVAPGGSAPGWGRGGPGGGGFSVPVGGGSSAGGDVYIIVQGAVDKEGTARQIRDLLRSSDIRNGRKPVPA